MRAQEGGLPLGTPTFFVYYNLAFVFATGKYVEEQTLVYRGKKDWKANDGKTYHCLIFSLLDYEEKTKEKELLRFFVTDDHRHMPVRIDFYLRFGTAKAYLAKSN